MRNKIVKALGVFAVLSPLFTGCSVQNMDMNKAMSALQKGTQALTLSNAQVQAYVKQAVGQMDAQNQIAPASSAYTKRLNRLTKGLTGVNGTPLNFKVYVTKDINAFACADGSVRVYTGIMDMMDDDELIGIIGHEIGHVAKEHSKEAFKQALINSALSDAIGSTGATAAALTQSQLAQLATAMASAKYSRSQENEADDYGYSFLKQNGKNPYAMVMAFEKMQKLENQSGNQASSLQNMFSDHPQTSERIKRMTQKCIADGYKRPGK